MKLFIACILYLHLLSVYTDTSPNYCYVKSNATALALSFSTKTAYQKVKGTQDEIFYLPNCLADKIWIIIRHGTRLPNAKTIKRLAKLQQLRDKVLEYNAKELNDSTFCDDDMSLLKKWQWIGLKKEDSNVLSVQGWNDLKLLAAKYKRIFPHLFDKEYNSEDYLFKHTKTSRTKDSFRAFSQELFDKQTVDQIMAEIEDHREHILLRPYELCDSWQEQKKSYKPELKKFETTELFLNMIDDISMRLKLDFKLSTDQLKDIFDICRFEQAWDINDLSPWCSMINFQQANILEYFEDMKYYYQSGPGGKYNKNIHCYTVSDMINHMKSNDGPKVVAYFSHASAIQLFLTSLGLFSDTEALRADNYEKMKERKWRTSLISPFAANAAIVKYKCDKNSSIETEDKIKLYLNERAIELDQCDSPSDGCRLSEISKIFSYFEQNNCEKIYCDKN